MTHSNEAVTAQQAVEFLNEALLLDKEAVHTLFQYRVPCNENLANHPTIQCRQFTEQDPVIVGMLGLMNGLFGKSSDTGRGFIFATYADNGKIISFGMSKETEHADTTFDGRAEGAKTP